MADEEKGSGGKQKERQIRNAFKKKEISTKITVEVQWRVYVEKREPTKEIWQLKEA